MENVCDSLIEGSQPKGMKPKLEENLNWQRALKK